MLAGFIVGFLTSVPNPIYNLRIEDFGMRLYVTTAISLAVWVPVMLLTKPETDERLDTFYRRVRPGGPGWKRQRERTGIPAGHSLGKDLARSGAGLMLLFGLMFGIGGLLFGRTPVVIGMFALAAVGAVLLRSLRPAELRPAPAEAEA
jgi:hypothetical protein